jgi:CheY-like chemotaxis protein
MACDVGPNGQEALNLLAVNEYHLIFMDCQMPLLNGFEAAEAIRRCEGKNRHIPIIAMTGYALSGDKEKCLAAGMKNKEIRSL